MNNACGEDDCCVSVFGGLPGGLMMTILGILLIFAATGGLHFGRYMIVTGNLRADKGISEACAELSRGAGREVQYLTMWTEFCRPKGTKTSRAICIPAAPQMVLGAPMAALPQGQGYVELQQQLGGSPMVEAVPVPPEVGKCSACGLDPVSHPFCSKTGARHAVLA